MPSSMFGSQTVVTGGQFHQHNAHQNIHHHHKPVSKDPWERLLEAASPSAFHNSNDVDDPPKCHPNTRVAVLNKIMDWIRGLDPETRDALIMWLNGPAGSGKSAIARSIAELCYEAGILVASYFFSRADSTRNHSRSLIATIAYQGSIRFPDIRDHLIQTIDLDPFIFTRSLDAQILALIVEPLQECIEAGFFDAMTAPRIVIIDGLDECDDRENQVKILSTISRALQQHHLPLIFLIASRPEHDIKHAFDVGYLKKIATRIALNNDYLPSDDIRLFLQDKFTEIKNTHPFKQYIPPAWPSPEVLESLINKSSGQFVYASTVVKFTASSRHRPHLRLDIVRGLRPVDREMPFAELDALYIHILSSADNHKSVLRVLTLCFSSHWTIKVSDIEQILSLNSGDVSWLLCDLTSLISVKRQINGYWQVLTTFHASLVDFLLDYSRSQEFYAGDPLLSAELAHLCIHFLEDREKNFSVAQSAVHLFQKAICTQELRNDLTNFSIGSLLVDCDYLAGVVSVLTSIKLWKFDNGMDLHGHQLQLFDQFAQGIMEKMYSDTKLTALVAVAKMNIDWLSFHNGVNLLFQLDEAQLALDKLSFSKNIHSYSKYGQFISEFLEDPNRSGVYALNGQRYATAAVYFQKHISNHSELIIPSLDQTTRKIRRRRNLPWLWQKLVHQARSSEASQIDKWPLRGQGKFQTTYSQHDSEHAFHLALKYVVHVLPKSDISEELTALARQQKFGPLLRKDARRKRAVTREIARYLARVDAKDSLAESITA